MSDEAGRLIVEAAHEAGMMPDWRWATDEPALDRRLATQWPNLLRSMANEIARLRAELAECRGELRDMERERDAWMDVGRDGERGA